MKLIKAGKVDPFQPSRPGGVPGSSVVIKPVSDTDADVDISAAPRMAVEIMPDGGYINPAIARSLGISADRTGKYITGTVTRAATDVSIREEKAEKKSMLLPVLGAVAVAAAVWFIIKR